MTSISENNARSNAVNSSASIRNASSSSPSSPSPPSPPPPPPPNQSPPSPPFPSSARSSSVASRDRRPRGFLRCAALTGAGALRTARSLPVRVRGFGGARVTHRVVARVIARPAIVRVVPRVVALGIAVVESFRFQICSNRERSFDRSIVRRSSFVVRSASRARVARRARVDRSRRARCAIGAASTRRCVAR